jgi:Heparinase II/III-like protein/Heparinase II/III N-terminus
MITVDKLKRMLRGDVSARTVVLETLRRTRVLRSRRRERDQLAQLAQPARLCEPFARMTASELVAHFQSRTKPQFFPGFDSETADLQRTLFPKETIQLLAQARRIRDEHCWPLVGFGEKCFGAGEIDWNLDPLSGFDWPITFHADINLIRNDGSDARVVWELNRFGHFITLGRAYALTGDETFSTESFRQLASWRAQNPVARGVNWNCAMEVALRAMNLLAGFTLFLRSPQMNEQTLRELLATFDQHGAHIRRNLEFSHIATSNHYLADVTGLLWLGVMLPELEAAQGWREFGMWELLNEMDKQILADGADYEASTGYHRLKLELFLYSFVLCHLNTIDISERYWKKLRAMVDYVRAYVRPDGRAPLIGDSDSGQLLPIVRRTGDDHAYVLALGAAVFQETQFKIGTHASGMQHAGGVPTEELLWILGEQGVRDYVTLPDAEPAQSQAFPEAGTYVLRENDLYLLFNASGAGVNGRGSHGHNDALSLEVSACGTAFIVDPGTYVYTADLKARHLFRSTAYHSTIEIDGVDQNTTGQQTPFVIGDEARPRVLNWKTEPEHDLAVAEHRGYTRLPEPVTHRRTVRFYKQERCWMIQDELTGAGTHSFSFRFHFAPGLETKVRADRNVEVWDKTNGARLLIAPSGVNAEPILESRFSSRDYGAKESSVSVCWTVRSPVPLTAEFVLVPIRAGEDEGARLSGCQNRERDRGPRAGSPRGVVDATGS